MMRYAEIDYDASTVTEYARHGACNHCGDCCRPAVRFAFCGLDSGASSDEKKAGGPTTDGKGKWQAYEADDGVHWHYVSLIEVVPRELACEGLRADGTCDKYEERNPYCRNWPLTPTDITAFPRCGFSFTKIAEEAM
jgi:Fe-S-cluster containining protein